MWNELWNFIAKKPLKGRKYSELIEKDIMRKINRNECKKSVDFMSNQSSSYRQVHQITVKTKER